ncbi:hypothetical protein CK936_16285 [Streptomyces albireticuli]|uniref:Uncharacterized protein n=2 Tax=Streptomyces albireticuli TaxID=1940 RepID=A0A2A2D8U3_9ACTN|nr:hypothetical protein CK936_16285 [Streptomyces albireticuli]
MGAFYVDLPTLGYEPTHDQIVSNVQTELRRYTEDPKDAMEVWGWELGALRPEDKYRIDQLLRMYIFQRDQVVSALKRLDRELGAYASRGSQVEKQLKEFIEFLPKETDKARIAKAPSSPRTEFSSLEEQQKYLLEFGWDQDTGIFPAAKGVIAFQHPAVTRCLGMVPSLDMGYDGDGTGEWVRAVYFRLTDRSYPREWIKDGRLYDLVDTALALQAELQLQCLLTDREFTRLIETRGQEFEYLKAEAARKAADEQEDSNFWAAFGDVLGIVSAVAGALALIPVFTPIAGPIAAVTAIGALAAHTTDAALKGDWDAATIVGLGADALAALPAIGAIAKSIRSGKAVLTHIGAGSKAVFRAQVATRRAGLIFLAETGGTGAADAAKIFDYIGTKGAKAVGASASAGKLTGKVLQGSVNLSTQIPLVIEMATGKDMGQEKNVAGGAALTANYGQTIGSWGAVGTAAKKTATVSLAAFAKIIAR